MWVGGGAGFLPDSRLLGTMRGWREALEVDVFGIPSDGRYILVSQMIYRFF